MAHKPARPLIPSTLFLTLVLLAVPAAAQRFEITPLAMFRTGGSLDSTSADGFEADLQESAGWGLTFGVRTRPEAQVEFHYSQHAADVEIVDFYGNRGIANADLEYLHFGGAYFWLPPGKRPVLIGYLAGSLGATRFSGEGADAATFFSTSVGGGADVMLTERISIRADARFYTTFFSTSGAIACTPVGCATAVSGNYFNQFSGALGVAFRF